MSVCRLVIADDAPDIQFLLESVFAREADFEVVGTAGDGQEAVDAAVEHQPDLILLDLSMPVMDGLEAIPVIREQSPATGIVVLSGFLAENVRQQVLDLGAVGAVEKGLDLAALVGKVRELWVGWAGRTDGLA